MTSAQSSVFCPPPERSWPQRVLDHVRGPWSWRRAWGLACAALAGIPGVRRHVLYTTPLKAHPLFRAHEAAWTHERFARYVNLVGWASTIDELAEVLPPADAEHLRVWLDDDLTCCDRGSR